VEKGEKSRGFCGWFGMAENGNSQLMNPPDEPAGFRIKTGFPPVVRNINLENITGKKSAYALLLNGYEHSPITELSITLLTSYLL
jgi:hypothetical protein